MRFAGSSKAAHFCKYLTGYKNEMQRTNVLTQLIYKFIGLGHKL